MPNNDYLIHYGILGIKWGVRRFETKSGHLTAAGKERYKTDTATAKSKVVEAKAAQKEAQAHYNKVSRGGMVYWTKEAADAEKAVKDAASKTEYTKIKLDNEKIKEKLNSKTREKSKHRLKLEEKYKSEGMSDEEAEIAAYKRARTEKILAAMGGVAVAAAAVYVIKNHYDKNVDKLIKPGTMLQNIAGRENKGIEDAFYFSSNNSDNKKYAGMLAYNKIKNGGSAFRQKIQVTDAVKVASEKSATDVLSQMLKDNPEYSKVLSNSLTTYAHALALMGGNPKHIGILGKAQASLKEGKIDQNVYRAFNSVLVDHSPAMQKMSKKFYDTLTDKGYNAILDVNDRYYSGYNSKSPMIAFNAKDKLSLKTVEQIASGEAKKGSIIETGKLAVQNMLPGSIGGLAFASIAAKGMEAAARSNVVKDYRKEHPDSKLTNQEILDNYYNY